MEGSRAAPPLEGAVAHLNQVFLDLLRNSLQAIEEASRPEGRIEVATRYADDTAIIEITDDGRGIPADPEADAEGGRTSRLN